VSHHVRRVAGLDGRRQLLDDVAGARVRLDVRVVERVAALGSEVADLLLDERVVVGVKIPSLYDAKRAL
jgi:hypothetical protein